MTAHTTLIHSTSLAAARADAISRIRDLMLPGARALAATRTPKSPVWIEREIDLAGTAPFGDLRVSLYWRDHAPLPGDPQATYRTQIVVHDSVGPELLAELARVAAIYTAQIVRECEALTASQCAALDADADAYRLIATGGAS